MSEQDIRKYREMLAEDPRSRAFAPLAEAYRKAGMLDEAINVAREGLKNHPAYSGGLVVLGRAHFEKGEHEAASEVLRKAVQENPENYLGQKFLGKVLLEKGDVSGARRALEAARFLSPDDAEVESLIKAAGSGALDGGAVEFSGEGTGGGGDEAGLVTYDQRTSLPDSGGEDTEPGEGEGAQTDSAGPEGFGDAESGQPLEPEETPEGNTPEEGQDHLEEIEELGPEAVAFIEDAEDFEEDLVIVPEEEDIPPSAGTMPGESPAQMAEGVLEEPPGKAETGSRDSLEEASGPFPGRWEKGPPIVVPPPSFTLTDLAGRKPVPPAGETSEAVPAEPSGEPPVSREDLSTETLADLYASQGMKEKAAGIYRKILAQNPDAAGIREKLLALDDEGGGTEPARDASSEGGLPAAEGVFEGDDDPLAILQQWLENAERMKRQ